MIKKKKQVVLIVDRNDLEKQWANSLIKNIRRDKFAYEVRQAMHSAHTILFKENDDSLIVIKN